MQTRKQHQTKRAQVAFAAAMAFSVAFGGLGSPVLSVAHAAPEAAGNGGNGGNGGAGGAGGILGNGGNGGAGGDCTIIVNEVTQVVGGGFAPVAVPIPVAQVSPVVIQPALVGPDPIPYALPLGPVVGQVGNPLMTPVIVDGVVVDMVPLCYVFAGEPIGACNTGYYFFEPHRAFCCFAWA